ncbi:MAG TPA: hypothetical protein PKA06_03955 [Gemmatales bacterium]|nr:hypothetical protein [Gemmatales bacterium]
MARCYSLETMLHKVPRDLLHEYFIKVVGNDLGLDWKNLSKTNLKPILKAIKKLKQSEKNLVERQLQNIFELACKRGIEALQEAAHATGDTTFINDCHPGGPHAKAMWSFLHRDTVFQKAQQIHIVAMAHWWRLRNDLQDYTGMPLASPQLKILEGELARFLEKEEGRGKRCTAEHIERGGKDYILVHADDYPEEKLMHTGMGRLISKTIRGTFLVVYALDRKRRTLQVDSDVPSRHKERLEIILIGSLFKYTLNPFVTPVYNIDQLKHDSMSWITEPGDGAEVRVQSLHLQSVSNPKESIVVNSDSSLPTDRIYEQMRETLLVHVDQLKVTRAKVRVDFQAMGDRPISHTTFELTEKTSTFHPHKVGEERADIIQRCLEKSGVMVHDRPVRPVPPLGSRESHSQVG